MERTPFFVVQKKKNYWKWEESTKTKIKFLRISITHLLKN